MDYKERKRIEKKKNEIKAATYRNMLEEVMNECNDFDLMPARIRLKVDILINHLNFLKEEKYSA